MARNLPAEKNFVVTYSHEPGGYTRQEFYTKKEADEFAQTLPLMGVKSVTLSVYNSVARRWEIEMLVG